MNGPARHANLRPASKPRQWHARVRPLELVLPGVPDVPWTDRACVQTGADAAAPGS